MPTSLAASTTSVPAGTAILWPSMVTFTSGMYERRLHGADVVEAVLLVLVVEVPHRRFDHPAGRVAEAAQAAAVLQAFRHAFEDAELDLRALAGEDAFVRADGPIAADATGRALAAGLEGVEAQQSRRCFDDAVRVVHDDDPARTAHGAKGFEPVEVGRGVEHRAGENLRRRPTGPEHLDGSAGEGSAGQFLDDVPVRDPDLDLEVAGLLDIAAHRDHARAFGLLGASLGVLGAAVPHDPRHGRQGLDVVDRGRHAPGALHSRERRPRAWLRPLAFERLEQRRLLAADVGAVPAIQAHVHRVIGAEWMLAEVALRMSLGDGVAQHLVRKVVLAADVDPRLVAADCEGGDHRAFDERVGRVFHQVAVLCAARLRLVGIDDDVLGTGMILGHERPLGGGGEVRAPAPPQARALDLVDDLRGGHLLEHLARGRVAAEGFVDLELFQVRGLEPLGEDGTADGPPLLRHSSWSFCEAQLQAYAPLPDPLPEGERGPESVALQPGRRSSSASGRTGSGGRGAPRARTHKRRGTPPLRTRRARPSTPARPRARRWRP